MGNHKDAILKEETDFLSRPHDLFPLVQKPISPLRDLLERSTHSRLFGLRKKKSLTVIQFTTIQSGELTCLSPLLTIVGLVMLVAPLWILTYVDDMFHRLSVITAFVVAFLPLVFFTSTGKSSEASLAATAA